MYIFHVSVKKIILFHKIGGNRKCSYQSTSADQKSLEAVFSIAICRQSGE